MEFFNVRVLVLFCVFELSKELYIFLGVSRLLDVLLITYAFQLTDV